MGMQWVRVQPAYILYTKPFRETSLLLEVFSRDYGRVSLVARGAKSSSKTTVRRKRPRFQGLLQPFVPLCLSWRGRTELCNLTDAEPQTPPPQLVGQLLFCGWYINELLARTLRHGDANGSLFFLYQSALYGLLDNVAHSLRQFV